MPSDHKKNEQPEPEPDDRNSRVLLNAVEFVANEPLLLAQYQEICKQSEFPQLWPDGDDGEFDKRVQRVVEHLGGPPGLYVLGKDQEPPAADNYPEAAMREALEVFSRARKSVIRAHLFRAGSSLLAAHPDLLDLPEDPETQDLFVRQAQAAFWEHAEAAYI